MRHRLKFLAKIELYIYIIPSHQILVLYFHNIKSCWFSVNEMLMITIYIFPNKIYYEIPNQVFKSLYKIHVKKMIGNYFLNVSNIFSSRSCTFAILYGNVCFIIIQFSRYRRRKWTRRHEFKSWTRLITFHIALIPLGKVWIQLFSLQL